MRCHPFILAAAVLAVPAASLPAANQAGDTVYTNKTQFRIPFRYDHTEMQRLGAREVQLFVSTDQGRTWQLAQRVVPMAGRFDFRAAADGEFWFSVRTLDGQNELHPASDAVEPGLKVVVDTTPPELELLLRQLAPGRVELSWNCSEIHADLSQLVMEYIQSGDAGWSAVQVVAQASGRTAWSVPRGGQVAVRGAIRDLAGNEARSQNQIEIAPAATTTPAADRVPDRDSLQPPVPPPSSIPDLNDPIASGEEAPPQPPTITPAHRLVTDDGSNRPPVLGGSREMTPATPRPADSSAESVEQSNPFSPEGLAARDGLVSPAERFEMAEPAARAPQLEQGLPSRAAPPFEPPAAPTRRLVNALGFQIEYAIEGIGSSGVGAVELFITENNGQKWFKYGDDADLTSPAEIRVPRDGIYGFTIRVRSGAGLAEAPPRPGELPALVVGVDTTPPIVELMPVRARRDVADNRLEIAWRVHETNPAEKPIALSYIAADRQGDWRGIAGWHNDTGRYLWTTDPTLPPKVFVRVTARDAAGNQNSAETPEPIVVDTARPSARIMAVQPAGPGR